MRSDKKGQLNKNMRGFTLVELIVVLVIVAILAAVAVPTFLAFIDRAKEKDYETNAQKCLASTQAALSEIFSDAGNSFSIKKRESVRNLCDSEKKSTEFIVWTKDALDSKTVRALPDYIASYTIEKALYEEAGYYFAYDGKKWEIFRSDKAREEAIAFLSVDNSKAIYMWPYKQDLAYYPTVGDENQYADDDGTIKVVNLSLDAKGMGYVYFSNKGSDLNSGINTMKVVFWKESGTNNIKSTWTVDNNGNDCFTYDNNTEYELYIDKDKNGNKRFSTYEWISTDDNTNLSGKSAVETYIYETKPDKKIYNLTLSLGEANQVDVPEVYISKNAFSSLLSSKSATADIKSVTRKGLNDYKSEMEVPQKAERIDDTSVKDGFVYAWYEENTFVWWTNAGTVYMPADCSGMCSKKDKLVDFDFSGFDFSNTTNTSNMFFDCNNLISVTGINGLTSLSKAEGMFKSCEKLEDVNISSVSGNIESVAGMFEGCESITSIIFSDDFVTTAVSDYENTFKGCKSLSSLSIGGFDFTGAKKLDSMFEGCEAITGISPSNWMLINVTSMKATFKGCNSLSILNTPSMTTSRQLKNLEETFAGCYSLDSISLSNINAGAVTTTKNMFSMEAWKESPSIKNQTSSLKNIYFGAGFDTSNVTDMSGMFEYCVNLEKIDGMDNIRTAKVANMSNMFAYTYNLTELKLASFDTKSVTNCDKMFYYEGDNKLTKVYVSKKFNISGDKEMFSDNTSYIKLVGGRNTTVSSINDSEKYDTSLYAIADGLDGKKGYFIADYTQAYIDKTKFKALFSYEITGIVHDTSEHTLSEIQYKDGIIDIRDTAKTSAHYVFAWKEGNIIKWWSDAEAVHLPDDCERLFQNNTNITSFSFEGLDVSNVTTFNYMFDGCSNLTSVTFGNMFYTDNLKKMKIMFRGCSSLISIDLSGWNTRKIAEYSEMFNNCSELTTIYSDGSFSVPGTTANMFSNCTKLKGGSNSAYSSLPNPQRSQYARIDGGTSSPGYFTRK